MKVRIYVDASVVGGCEDDEFAEQSVPLRSGPGGGRRRMRSGFNRVLCAALSC